MILINNLKRGSQRDDVFLRTSEDPDPVISESSVRREIPSHNSIRIQMDEAFWQNRFPGTSVALHHMRSVGAVSPTPAAH